MYYSFSKLDPQKISKIQQLEKELGKAVIAFSLQDVKPASLSQDELSKIQQLEKELAVSLLAVNT